MSWGDKREGPRGGTGTQGDGEREKTKKKKRKAILLARG